MKKYHFLLLLFGMFSSCKKEAELSASGEIKTFMFKESTATYIDRDAKEITVELGDYHSRKSLIPSYQLSYGAKAFINGVAQVNFTTVTDFTNPVTYQIVAQDGSSTEWLVKVTTNNSKIGLSGKVDAEKRISRGYNWYFDQSNSGKYSFINGGAAVIAMCMRFTNYILYLNPDVETIRNEGKPEYFDAGVWMANPFMTNDVLYYLRTKVVPTKVVKLSQDQSEIIQSIDFGYPVIIISNFSKVRNNINAKEHTHRFYSLTSDVSPHYILIKGYKKVSNLLYFECYDPKSYGLKYLDNGDIKGENRYYLASDLWSGVTAHGGWKYGIVVGEKGIPMQELKSEVDSTRIERAEGY